MKKGMNLKSNEMIDGMFPVSTGKLVAGVETHEPQENHVVEGPLTTDLTREGAPELLLNEIDRQIVKIRPMATPVDQISRYAGHRYAGSMLVDYYSVDTKGTQTAMQNFEGEGATEGTLVVNDDIFEPTDTMLVQSVKASDESDEWLVLYVKSKSSDGTLTVQPVNAEELPGIAVGKIVIRMGRAAAELDVQSPQYEALPYKERNYCQIFKMQVEQSILQKLSNKEVPWTLSDQEEAALYDMRLAMEKSFMFGGMAKVYDSAKKQYVYFTRGIWWQAGKEFEISGDFDEDQAISMMKESFTGNNGSRRKILLAGSDLVADISKLPYTRYISRMEHVSKWGIDFTTLNSKFGTLYVVLSEIFDEIGAPGEGFILDPEYLAKYSHIPFTVEQLNLRQSGQRNVDALVMTEASCLVLRYPKSHMRVVKG